jgi:hypothetical protein
MSAGRGEAGARFRVVVTDHAFPDLDTERAVVEAAGGRIDDVQRREPGDLAPLVADADALLVQFATIDEESCGRCGGAASSCATASAWTASTSRPPRREGSPSSTFPTTRSTRSRTTP